MSNIIFVYVTCPNEEEAEKLAEKCVKRRLAACGNILPKMRSVYVWEGKIQKDDEAVLILKTRRPAFNDLKTFIVKEHPYEIPCVMGWDIEEAHLPYLNWLNNQVAD